MTTVQGAVVVSESHNTFGRCRPRRMESTGPYCSLKSMRKMKPIATGAIIIGIVNTMRKVQPVRATKPPVSAVAWGDRVFVGPGSLAHWLKVRGIGYSVWADRHPPANHLLQREKAQRTRSKK